MANVLTPLIPSAIAALDVVSRELVGFIPSVNRDPKADRTAKGQTLTIPVAPANAQGDIAASATLSAESDQTAGSVSLVIDNYKKAGFNWTGEEILAVNSPNGIGQQRFMQDQIEQALRSLVNGAEGVIATAAALSASRAYGTAGTTPFATTTGDTAQVRKVLDDNGAPFGNRSLIIDTTSGAALRTLSNLTKANEAGTSVTLRDGQLLDLNGLSIKESAQVVTPSVGTAASATTNNAGYAVGATTITLASAGTGTILAGDIVTFAGDTNKYVVATGNTDVSAGGTIVLQAPGLRKAMSAATKAITVVAAGPRMVAFSQNAICLATRLPAAPPRDLAIDRQTITDPRSGISFELVAWPGQDMVVYQVRIAYGVKVVKPEHIAILLG